MMVPVAALAAGGNVHLDKADIDLYNKGSLQNGARLFVNYCMGCHSLQYMRYNRMGKDLGISDELVADNLLFAADKVKFETTPTEVEGAQYFLAVVVCLFGIIVAIPVSFDLISLLRHWDNQTKRPEKTTI